MPDRGSPFTLRCARGRSRISRIEQFHFFYALNRLALSPDIIFFRRKGCSWIEFWYTDLGQKTRAPPMHIFLDNRDSLVVPCMHIGLT